MLRDLEREQRLDQEIERNRQALDAQLLADLRAMRDHLRRYGWLQWMGGLDKGPRCMSGLIYSATKRWYLDHQRGRTARILQALGFPDEREMTVWNDADGRTQAEVDARLTTAIDTLALKAE